MTYNKLKTNFERELIVRVITNLRRKNISEVRAKKIAQVFLPTLKSESAEEFCEELSKLGRHYPEIMEAFIVTFTQYEKETVTTNLQRIRAEFENGGLS